MSETNNTKLSTSDITRNVSDSDLADIVNKIDNADTLSESIKKDYADFIPTTKTKGTDPVTPPSNGGKNTMTKDEILAIRDGATRRQAIADNPQLFGLDQ